MDIIMYLNKIKTIYSNIYNIKYKNLNIKTTLLILNHLYKNKNKLNNKIIFKKFLKKIYKNKQLNFFYYIKTNFSNLKFDFNMYSNKFYCFWPLYKKKLGDIYHKINVLKKIWAKRKTNITLKSKKIQKKMYYFNFHRKTIKYFWKSQEHFKFFFLKKTRYTTRKFKKKFENWYKKNKKLDSNSKYGENIKDFLLKNLIFLSKKNIKHLLNTNLILINGEKIKTDLKIININDIVSAPQNYTSYYFSYFKSKFYNIKKIKKIKFIYYQNKRSQWKNLKKKNPDILFYNVYNENKFYNDVEVDNFSNNICYIKKMNQINNYNFNYKRHNLEKLNTYKLNV